MSKKIPEKLNVWIEARKRFHLSHAQVQMAHELGMEPKKFGKLANHKQERWKAPLPEYIEELYRKRFGKAAPDQVKSIEQLAKDQNRKKAERKQRREEKKLIEEFFSETDLLHLRAAIEIARQSREHGNHPFGALLVDENGAVLLQAENTVITERDCTWHAETNLMRTASKQFEAERLAKCTLYTSTEPCAMCCGAIYWGHVGATKACINWPATRNGSAFPAAIFSHAARTRWKCLVRRWRRKPSRCTRGSGCEVVAQASGTLSVELVARPTDENCWPRVEEPKFVKLL